MRCSNASYFSEALKVITMVKQTTEKQLAAAPASKVPSRPATRSSRSHLPPSDPTLVEEVQDSDSAEPAVVPKSGPVKQTVAEPRQADEAINGKGPVKQTVPEPRQAGEAVYGKGGKPAVAAESTSTPAPGAKVPSPKRSIPDDDEKGEASRSKKTKAEHPLFLIPSFLSDEHALDAASPVPTWDPNGWDKHCRRGIAYRVGSEASDNTRRLVSLLRIVRKEAQRLGFPRIAVADRFLKNNLVRLNTVAGDEILATMWAHEYDKPSINQLYLAFVPEVLRSSHVGSTSKQVLIEELVACKVPFMFFDYMEGLAQEMRDGSYTQKSTHDEALASMLQIYIFCADQQFERSVEGFEADADEAEAAAAAEDLLFQEDVSLPVPEGDQEADTYDSEDSVEPGLRTQFPKDDEQSVPEVEEPWAMPPPASSRTASAPPPGDSEPASGRSPSKPPIVIKRKASKDVPAPAPISQRGRAPPAVAADTTVLGAMAAIAASLEAVASIVGSNKKTTAGPPPTRRARHIDNLDRAIREGTYFDPCAYASVHLIAVEMKGAMAPKDRLAWVDGAVVADSEHNEDVTSASSSMTTLKEGLRFMTERMMTVDEFKVDQERIMDRFEFIRWLESELPNAESMVPTGRTGPALPA